MAKFGYTCKCGWILRRGPFRHQLTRKQYAQAKRLHAQGEPRHGIQPCKFLADELKCTQRKVEG